MKHKHYWEGKKFSEQLIKAAQDRAAKEGQGLPDELPAAALKGLKFDV